MDSIDSTKDKKSQRNEFKMSNRVYQSRNSIEDIRIYVYQRRQNITKDKMMHYRCIFTRELGLW